jgi:hypothetical protein
MVINIVMTGSPVFRSTTSYADKLYRLDVEGFGTPAEEEIAIYSLDSATKAAQHDANQIATSKGFKVTGTYACPVSGQEHNFNFSQTGITVEGIPATPPASATPETQTTSSQISDASGLAKAQADEMAANTNTAQTVTVNGTTVTSPPPPRPNNIVQAAKGTPLTSVPIEGRQIARNVVASMQLRDMKNTNDDPDDTGSLSPGNPKYNIQQFYGAARNRTAQIPGMEALMMDVPNASLGKVLTLLPPVFSNLMPLGSILSVTSKSPIPLNSIAALVGGAALGAATGQALRSQSGGIGVVPGITGMLGAVAVTSALGQRSNSIMNPSTASTLGTVLGTVARIGLIKQVTGSIPVSSAVLGVAAGVALKSFGNSLSIPTSILGTSGSTGLSAITSILGSTVSGRIPILPTNLSLPGVTGLSGLAQNVSPGLAENMIPRSQLGGLLPGNIQNQIQSSVPPRVTSGAVNDVQARNEAAPEQSPGPVPTGAQPGEKQPLLTGRINGRIPYEQRASDSGITLGQMSNAATPWRHPIQDMPSNNRTIDQIIYNLSWIAQNILDPIKAAWPGMIITCGFRGPDGTNPSGDHGHGAACDISWGNGQSRKHYQIAQWIRQNNIPVKQLILEGTGRSDWIHVAGGPYSKHADYGANKDMTTWTGGSPYQKGLYAKA